MASLGSLRDPYRKRAGAWWCHHDNDLVPGCKPCLRRVDARRGRQARHEANAAARDLAQAENDYLDLLVDEHCVRRGI